MQFRHFLVSGRVQGVSFRAFTAKKATELGLSGWVRNLRDGRVEILVAGPAKELAQFEDVIALGPTLARVDGIEKRDVETELPHRDFQMRETEELPWSAGH